MVFPSFGINQQEEGIKLLKKAAEGGAKRAAYLLGGIFLYGDCGQTINYVEARHWLSLASEQNHADATFLLAIIYYKGLGVEHDLEKCAQLCLKSAQLGNGEARLTVALMYARGEGLPEVPEQAIYWAKKAADQGEPGADRIYQTLLKYYYFDNDAIIPDTLQDIDFNLLQREK